MLNILGKSDGMCSDPVAGVNLVHWRDKELVSGAKWARGLVVQEVTCLQTVSVKALCPK